jgi:tetratricopeptide (TPR) repeat protein
LTYADARQHATQIAVLTAARRMPPWKPEPGYGEFAGARRLSSAEIDTIQQWVSSGAPEGDPAQLPALPRWPSTWQLGEPDLVVTLPEYTLPAEGLDVFRNFVVPVPINGMRYVRGLEFSPGSTAVHHANIRIDPTPASRQLDEADPQAGYEGLILNSADYPDGYFLGWTPGQIVPLAPAGFGWTLRGGTDFVVQLHMRPTGKPERLAPAIALYFTSEAPSAHPAMLRLGRQNLDIAPGDAHYRSYDTYTLPVDAQVQAIQPHSHYRARTMSAWATLPDRSVRWLIKIPQWDFGWQDAYRYSAPFWLPAGSTIFTEYEFDNSSANPANPASPPVRALWGFRSSDEMADTWIQVLTRSEPERQRLVADFRVKADLEDIAGYETRIREDPGYAALHNDVAVLYLEVGLWDGAIAHFERVAALQPASAPARFNIATALEAAGRFDEAMARYREAIAIDASYARAHVNMGTLLLRSGRVADAQQEYEAAIAGDPTNADAHNDLGRVLTVRGEIDAAVTQLREALRLRPAFPDAQLNMAEAMMARGATAEAIGFYREALRLRPDWLPCIQRLAVAINMLARQTGGSRAEALQLARRAVELTGGRDPETLKLLDAIQAEARR